MRTRGLSTLRVLAYPPTNPSVIGSPLCIECDQVQGLGRGPLRSGPLPALPQSQGRTQSNIERGRGTNVSTGSRMPIGTWHGPEIKYTHPKGPALGCQPNVVSTGVRCKSRYRSVGHCMILSKR